MIKGCVNVLCTLVPGQSKHRYHTFTEHRMGRDHTLTPQDCCQWARCACFCILLFLFSLAVKILRKTFGHSQTRVPPVPGQEHLPGSPPAASATPAQPDCRSLPWPEFKDVSCKPPGHRRPWSMAEVPSLLKTITTDSHHLQLARNHSFGKTNLKI